MELRVLRSVIGGGGGCVMAIVVKLLYGWSSCRCESDSIACSARFFIYISIEFQLKREKDYGFYHV